MHKDETKRSRTFREATAITWETRDDASCNTKTHGSNCSGAELWLHVMMCVQTCSRSFKYFTHAPYAPVLEFHSGSENLTDYSADLRPAIYSSNTARKVLACRTLETVTKPRSCHVKVALKSHTQFLLKSRIQVTFECHLGLEARVNELAAESRKRKLPPRAPGSLLVSLDNSPMVMKITCPVLLG